MPSERKAAESYKKSSIRSGESYQQEVYQLMKEERAS
jgi:hypothetical protein